MVGKTANFFTFLSVW